MRSSVVLGVFVLALAACSSAASSGPPQQAPSSGRPDLAPPATPQVESTRKGRTTVETGLVGSVVLGPGSAIQGPGRSGAKPVAGAKVVVSQPNDGPEVASTLTDDSGHYELALPPGTYRVTLETTVSFRFSKDLPATVSVTKGNRTTFDVLLDTGVR